MSADWMKSHRELYEVVPEAPDRIGYAELQKRLDWGHRNRVKRAVSTLVGLEVLAWQGARDGRAVARGALTLDQAIADGLQPWPDREHAMYPLLLAPVDEFLVDWHQQRNDPLTATHDEDGVNVHRTSALPGGSGQYTRPDLTAIAQMQYSSLGSWYEVHAIEVKAYWSLSRSSLFEAIAQASLQRCTFSWLIAWIPSVDQPHLTGLHKSQALQAGELIGTSTKKGPLALEAEKFGIGLAKAADLAPDRRIERIVSPQRRVMDPDAANRMLDAIQRRNAGQSDEQSQ